MTMAIHPLHTLGFEPITFQPAKQPRSLATHSLANLGFESATVTLKAHGEPASAAAPQPWSLHPATVIQPVGAMEAASGRTIVQPTDNSAINQALATDAMPTYKARLAALLQNIPGATLAATRDAKKPARLAEKIAGQGQPAETVSDYGAAQIAVDSPQAKDAVVAAVKRHFPVLRQQDHFAFGDPAYRYRSFSLQVQMPNHASEELQIVPREVLEANQQEHHDYKKARNAELAGRTADQATAAARALNDAAMDRFNRRNGLPPTSGQNAIVKGAVVKGSRVRLADGSLARVVYVDPNMRIARVRTEDGKNVTVRHKDPRQGRR
jgi:hypothetical protein